MNPLTIRVADVIHQTLTDRLVDEVAKAAKGQPIDLQIDSPGGSVRHGWKLSKALQTAKASGSKITATITGKAASMASVLAMVADTIRMEEGAIFMLHDASIPMGGNPAELRELADIVDELSDDLSHVYAIRTGKAEKEIRALMKSTTYFTADEAKAAGFIDQVFKSNATEIPMTLLDRIAALEKEVKAAKASTAPPAAVARRLEQVTKKTAAELGAERRELTGIDRAIQAHKRGKDEPRASYDQAEPTGLARAIKAHQSKA